MTVKFYLKRPSNPRESVIYAQFSHNRVCYKYYLMEKVHPVNWDFRAQRVKINTKRTGTLEINQRLENVSWKIIESFYLYQNKHCGHCPPPHSFRIILDEVFNKRSSIKNKEDFQRTFWGFFQNLLLRMESGSRLHTQKNTPLARTTVSNMRNLFNHLRAFEKVYRRPLDFDTIDMKFYYGFIDYMTKIKMVSVNTIGKLITNIKVIMREAVEFGYTTNMTFTHRKFRAPFTETDAVYLTETEIGVLSKLDLSDCKRLECVRDLFLIGCYTGLRLSDLSKLSIEAVNSNILIVTQIKTGDVVHVPLKSEVQLIIEKYGGAFPHAISSQKFNQYLKEICSMCEPLRKEVSITKFVAGSKILILKSKYEFVTSHTARRSFATNEYLARDLHSAEIRAITGHKTDKSFYKYVRISSSDNAENVARKWKERSERRLQRPEP
ncbi:phage integrase family protein [Sediminibacterium magnilacihabitans]|jgi:integrase|nr:phage integrase family protein [Sediminibacterium magnilacihabitans]